MRYRYIAVEGPIGVGKTSLARRIADRLEARLLLEETENPFLPDFYADRPGAAFQAQIFFLLSRHQQQRPLAQQELFHAATVCDYLFVKDRIFAYLNLSDEELATYEKLYRILVEGLPRPDLVLYLQARDEVLMRRIATRGREFERQIAPEYVSELNRAYEHFFFHYDDSPLLVVNSSEADLSRGGREVDELLRQIDEMRGGTRYYSPVP